MKGIFKTLLTIVQQSNNNNRSCSKVLTKVVSCFKFVNLSGNRMDAERAAVVAEMAKASTITDKIKSSHPPTWSLVQLLFYSTGSEGDLIDPSSKNS